MKPTYPLYIRHLGGGSPITVRVDSDSDLQREIDRQPRDGVYMTLNAVRSDYTGASPKNTDIDRRTCIFIDIDAYRESGQAATDAQKQCAAQVRDTALSRLAALNVPKPSVIDSGNGYYLIWRCNIDSDDTSSAIVKAFIESLANECDGPGAHIDRGVHDLARIVRVPGSENKKGTDTYLHRRCEILTESDELIAIDTLRTITELMGGTIPTGDPAASAETVKSYLGKHGYHTSHTSDLEKHKLSFSHCPKCDRETVNAAVLVWKNSNRPVAKCFHDTCGLDWTALQQLCGESYADFCREPHIIDGVPHPVDAPEVTAHEALRRYPYLYHEQVDYLYVDGRYRPYPTDELEAILTGIGTEIQRDDYFRRAAKGETKPPKSLGVGHAKNALAHMRATKRSGREGNQFWLTEGDDKNSFSFANGILDVAKYMDGQDDCLRPTTSEFFTKFRTPCEFQPESPEPAEWLKFIDSLQFTADEIECLQMMFGHAVFSVRRLQSVILLIGATAAGKGVITRLMTKLCGGLEAVAAMDTDSFAREFGLADCLGKRLILVSEAEGQSKNEKKIVAKLKAITGDDPVPVNRKHRDIVTAILDMPIILATNERLCLGDSSGAMARRIRLAHFRESFAGREDANLESRLNKELPGIVLWALEGLRKLKANDWQFPSPPRWQEVSDSLADDAAPMREFLTECFVLDDTCCTSRDLIREIYRQHTEIETLPAATSLANSLADTEPKLSHRGRMQSPDTAEIEGCRVYHTGEPTPRRPYVVRGLRPNDNYLSLAT